MDSIDILLSKFPNLKIYNEKVEVDKQFYDVMKFLKYTPELSFDMLLTIVAVDYLDYIELIYTLFSTELSEAINLSIKIEVYAESIIDIFPSAYFDECEIYDLFGVIFLGNSKIKRLLMPDSWCGHPLRKKYILNDERLSWNG